MTRDTDMIRRGDAAERKRRKNIGDHHTQMMDAQAQCVPCRLCGGKAVITDAGPGFGYTIECENAARFRKPTCLQSGTRISGWAYNVSDLWNRLNAASAPVVPAEGLEGGWRCGMCDGRFPEPAVMGDHGDGPSCPFCGAEPPDLHLSHITGRIFCEGCGADGPWSPAFDGDWNTRAHPVQEPPSPGVTAGVTGEEQVAWPGPGRFTDLPKRLRRAAQLVFADDLTEGWRQWISDVAEDAALKIEALERDLATPAPVVPAEGLDALLLDLHDLASDAYDNGKEHESNTIIRAYDAITSLRSAPPVGARVKPLVDDAEFLREAGTDAAKWAAGFKAVAERLGHDGMDEGWLIGWFANAIEASRRAAVSDELSLAAADVVAWFDLCRPDLSGPRISRLRYALAALLPAGEGK